MASIKLRTVYSLKEKVIPKKKQPFVAYMNTEIGTSNTSTVGTEYLNTYCFFIHTLYIQIILLYSLALHIQTIL